MGFALLRAIAAPYGAPSLQLPRCLTGARRNAPTGQQQQVTSLSMPKLQPGHPPSVREYAQRFKDNVKPAQRHLNATSTHSGIESLPTTSPRFWKTRRMTTTPMTDEDELNDDHSYDEWR
ncbi:hypothetical protein U9M48_037875 [Paspalum notatum var. saurae]|uniref:Uncharacterized protein n=2 Tax=Paspalum notatum var. saurae TaxID=547442 RepID=A0AAQ3UI52_PASNO